MRRFVVTLLVGSLVAMTSPAQAHDQAVPLVYAHRGGVLQDGQRMAPENTLGAFRRAHDQFGDRGVWLELDAQLTSDGELVVIHDQSLDRTTDCTGTVISRTAAEIAGCDARKLAPDWPDFEPVPRLADVLSEGRERGWRLMVELKNIPNEANFDPSGEAAAGVLVELVGETGFPLDSLLVQSFWPASLDQVRLRDQSIRLALLTTAALPGAPAGAGFLAHQNAAYCIARSYEVSAPDARSVDLNEQTVVAAQEAGKKVVVWTVNERADLNRVIDAWVDGIISDDPGLAYEVVGERFPG